MPVVTGLCLAMTSMSGTAIDSVLAEPPDDAIHRDVPSAPEIDFGRDVLTIFVARCFSCHGPDADARKAGLRLDERNGLLEGRRPVIVPGDADASLLLERIATNDPDDRMPPHLSLIHI